MRTKSDICTSGKTSSENINLWWSQEGTLLTSSILWHHFCDTKLVPRKSTLNRSFSLWDGIKIWKQCDFILIILINSDGEFMSQLKTRGDIALAWRTLVKLLGREFNTQSCLWYSHFFVWWRITGMCLVEKSTSWMKINRFYCNSDMFPGITVRSLIVSCLYQRQFHHISFHLLKQQICHKVLQGKVGLQTCQLVLQLRFHC